MAAFQFSLNKHSHKFGPEDDLAWAILHEVSLQLQDDSNRVVRIV